MQCALPVKLQAVRHLLVWSLTGDIVDELDDTLLAIHSDIGGPNSVQSSLHQDSQINSVVLICLKRLIGS